VNKYTDGDAVDIIESEGMGYAVEHYCDGSNFESEETAKLWDAAQSALNDLRKHLERQTGREVYG